MPPIRVRTGILGLALLAGLAAPPAAAADPAPTATVEEQRLGRAAPQEILQRSGFGSVAPRFARALARTRSYAQAERMVTWQGSRLWRRAVDRAQGRGPADCGTAGSTARAGGGGNYLSNEIAYRATLLRDRLGLHDTLPGGHVHTPVLQFGTGNTDPATGAVTDPEFVRNRLDIIAQVRAIVVAAANATSGVSAAERTGG